MAILFSSGVALERAFEIAGQTAGNIIIKEAVDQARKAVTEGEPPMLIVFIGGVVGTILIALYMPIFKMGELIKS
jgi:type IV pilus assembly protein PilC